MINKKKLDDMVDHSLDHLKTGIVEKVNIKTIYS